MICNKCEKRKTCGKPCKELEKLLKEEGKKDGINIYSSKYIRPKMPRKSRIKGHTRSDKGSEWREIPFSSLPKEVQDRL